MRRGRASALRLGWRGMDKFLVPARAVASASDDPHNLNRFVSKQQADHARALKELRAGQKAGCWSWWIFPTPPFVRNGVRVGSGTNRVYELEDDREGFAYLAFGNLRANYLSIVSTMNSSLEGGVEPRRLLGIDVPRAEASAKYFEHLAREADDEELGDACRRALELLKSKPKPKRKHSPE